MFGIILKNHGLGDGQFYWTPDGPSNTNAHLFKTRGDAMVQLARLPDNSGEIQNFKKGKKKNTYEVDDYITKLVSEVIITNGEHVLLTGKVQAGKTNGILAFILRIYREKHDKAVLVASRNHNADKGQLVTSVTNFNETQTRRHLDTLPMPHDLWSCKDNLAELIRTKSFINGLANKDTMCMVKKCLEQNPELGKQLIIIIDEADTVVFDQNGEGTDTEKAIASIWKKKHCFMAISVTATPMRILWCDRLTQVLPIKSPHDYIGINDIEHRPIHVIRSTAKNQEYDPRADTENLKRITAETSRKKSTLLITVSKRTKDHKAIIDFIIKAPYALKGTYYFEVNKHEIKVYNDQGDLINSISRTVGGKKTCAIDIALQQYIAVKHIVIVAGMLAGRGITFKSIDRRRHLTHQYIVYSKTTHLATAIQGLRILGRYKKNVKLVLYCSPELYEDLVLMDKDTDVFLEKSQECKRNQKSLDSLLICQQEYTNHWIAREKFRLTEYRPERGVRTGGRFPFEIVSDTNNEKERTKLKATGLYTISRIEMSKKRNLPGEIIHGVEGQVAHQNRTGKIRLTAFPTIAEITVMEEQTGVRFPHKKDLALLYELQPRLEGTISKQILRQIEDSENATKTIFVRNQPSAN